MEAMRQNWTDDRMDDLAAQVDAGFAQARVDVGSTREELRREIKDQGDEFRRELNEQGKELRGEIKGLGQELRGEMQALAAIVAAGQHTMLQICGGLAAALIAMMATLVAAVF